MRSTKYVLIVRRPMADIVTIDIILNTLKGWIETKTPVGPPQYLDAATKLVILKEDVDNQIAHYEALMAEEEAILVGNGESAAKAEKLRIRVIDYQAYLKLKAQEKRVTEFVRICKKMSTIISENNYL